MNFELDGNLSGIVYRYEWHHKINIVNKEYKERCFYVFEVDVDENCEEEGLYFKIDKGEDFEWTYFNYRSLDMITYFSRRYIYNLGDFIRSVLPKNYEYTASTFLQELRTELRYAALSIRSLKKRKVVNEEWEW
jgi:hypothetical protein